MRTAAARLLAATAVVVLSSGILLTAALPVLAGGSPPQPAPDAFTVERREAFDVLANDSDPDVEPLTVTGASAPGHGSVSCLSTGACTYSPTTGYVGPDAFTYTVSDGSLSATGTVTLTVTEPGAAGDQPVAHQDHAVTKAGVPVATDVTANDVPNGGAVALGAGPSHGTASCTPAGSCTYTPDSGFTGYDGFSYTIENGSGTATGSVLVTVVAAGAGYDPATTGSPASILQGESAAWTVTAVPHPDGLPQSYTALNPPPPTTVSLDGPHTLQAATIATAPGWSFAGSTLTAGPAALLGESTAAALLPPPTPIGPVDNVDGHVPILVGSRSYAFFHDADPTAVSCVDRVTGGFCPGYPHQLAVGSDDLIGPGAVVGSRIYVSVYTASSYAQRAAIALYCWDTATDQTCGLVVANRIPGTTRITQSAPRVVAGKVWFAADDGLLYCVDPATHQLCAVPAFATGLVDPFQQVPSRGIYDIVTHGTRVFVSRVGENRSDGILAACLDVAAVGPCPGWPEPRQVHSRDLVNSHDGAGTPDGVCAVDVEALICVLDATPNEFAVYDGWPLTDMYTSVSEEAEAGTRTLFATGINDVGLGCWDWSTKALCTGGFWVGGVSRLDGAQNPLPSAYGATFDGTCAVALGQSGEPFTMTLTGASPCTSLYRGGAPQTVDLRAQRCDGTVGAASWVRVAVLEANLTPDVEFRSFVVVVRDAVTGETLRSQEMVGTNGQLDLSGIDPGEHPALSTDATAVEGFEVSPWADGNPPRVELRWESDPLAVCFGTITVVDCARTASAPISILAALAGHPEPSSASVTLNPSGLCRALAVVLAGDGTGTASGDPPGIACGLTCSAVYVEGTVVALTADPDGGSTFAGWSGGGCTGTGTCAVTLLADTTVTAAFALLQQSPSPSQTPPSTSPSPKPTPSPSTSPSPTTSPRPTTPPPTTPPPTTAPPATPPPTTPPATTAPPATPPPTTPPASPPPPSPPAPSPSPSVGDVQLNLDSPSALPGSVTRASGSGCAAGEAITFFIAGVQVGTATADGSGGYHVSLDVPSLPIGRHTVEVRCGAKTASLPIDLVSSQAAGTGASTTLGLILVFVLLAGVFVLRTSPAPRTRPPVDDEDET